MKKLAVTCGDPSGVGLEITERCLLDHENLISKVEVLGPVQWVTRMREKTGVTGVALGESSFLVEPGNPTIEGSMIAYSALKYGASGCSNGKYRGIVTLPISKHWMQQAGFRYPGHTEFFADTWGGVPTMGFVGKQLKVVLVTWHIPLMSVGASLTEEAILRAINRAVFLVHACDPEIHTPQIGVCGLNPHAGENGLLGVEEKEFIDPYLTRLREDYPGLSSCQPADTVFMMALKNRFDVVVALYHDQGLGPLKTLEFDRAVNITLGLPHIRTSPDHGTGFDIAGKGIASYGSLHESIKLADRLCC